MSLEKCCAETTGKGTRHTTPTGPNLQTRNNRTSCSLVGNCLIRWSYVEQGIDEVIWAFLKISVEDGRIVTAHLDARHKMMLFRQLAYRHLPKNDLDEFSTVLGRLEDLYELRNLMAHGQWVTLVPQNTPAVMSLREKLPDHTPRDEIITTEITTDSLTATIDNMSIISNYLVDFRKKIIVLRSNSA
jgi:hypothetical protein